MTRILREAMVDILKNNIASVTFTKKDGTERVMKCTLKEDLLPKREVAENADRKVNLDVVAVYDLDKNAWRSFRVDAVSSIFPANDD